jgi:hypothetical protein
MLDSACKYERSLIRRAPANSVGGRCFNPAPAMSLICDRPPGRSLLLGGVLSLSSSA